MKSRKLRVSDISRNPDKQLVAIGADELMPLPCSGVTPDNKTGLGSLTMSQKTSNDSSNPSLDGVSCLTLPEPKSQEEEAELVNRFLSGLRKLFSKEDNWTFLQPLMLSLEYCAKCLLCSEECPIYIASGRQEIYRPTYRAEVLRRIKKKYLDRGGRSFCRFTDGDINLNWTTIARLAELSYRCTICRRCAQACPRGCDNGLITREIRKLFSQEMGIAPKELHDSGTVKQLRTGASTGMTSKAFTGIVEFMEEEIEEKTGKKIKIPIDKEGADILLIHNSGEYLSWLENPEAFAIIFDAAGLNWTLSSELGGYEATNYGVWYDDIQLARIVRKQIEVARKLKVKKIVIGECGHAHKALSVIADRLLTEETYIPRESFLPIFEDIVGNNKININPSKNNFPVTLHDPCNIVRLMGIVEPQRRILKRVCTQFREMAPNGVRNYCCGGGSGFAVMNQNSFVDWRVNIAGRMKVKQTLDTFHDVISPEIPKYICAPCSNCKGQLRELFNYYGAWGKYNILYGGLAELIVNAMADTKEPFIKWEWH